MNNEAKIKWKTKKGWLTPYSLTCGYIEINTDREHYSLELWQYGGTQHYNVRLHDCKKGLRIFWETFHKLADARQCFTFACKQYGLIRK